MSEQNTTFLSNKVDEVNPGNIFQELEEELSVTPEGEEKDKKSSHPLALAARIIEVVFGITLFFTIILSIDSGVRNNITDQIEWAPSPICDYMSIGADVSNDECKGLSLLDSETKNRVDELEKNLANNLSVLVPRRAKVSNIASSPEIQYIKQQTNTKVSIARVIDAFNEIRINATDLKWDDIECGNYSLNEKGSFSLDCTVYGSSLLSSSSKSNTSRATALAFVDKLSKSEKTGGFRLLNYPKSIGMEKFSSSDPGLKSTFSTSTKFSLKLQYLAANQ